MFLDVREAHEIQQGFIGDSVAVPLSQVKDQSDKAIADRDRLVIVYCAVGERSRTAARELSSMGYTNVVNLAGGFDAWKNEGLPWDNPSSLSADQLHRYSRHTVLPEVGVAGQEKLLNARVVVVGAGGLGSPVALYLAAAGVGTLGIVDNDVVELSNLQRQILHNTDVVGQAKTLSAAKTIAGLNADVEVVEHAVHLDASNALGILEGYDLIVDGTDSFPTRYLINDASRILDSTLR